MTIVTNPPLAVVNQVHIAGILAGKFANHQGMEAKIEAPEPRPFGALLFVVEATLSKWAFTVRKTFSRQAPDWPGILLSYPQLGSV